MLDRLGGLRPGVVLDWVKALPIASGDVEIGGGEYYVVTSGILMNPFLHISLCTFSYNSTTVVYNNPVM